MSVYKSCLWCIEPSFDFETRQLLVLILRLIRNTTFRLSVVRTLCKNSSGRGSLHLTFVGSHCERDTIGGLMLNSTCIRGYELPISLTVLLRSGGGLFALPMMRL